jgi:Putative metallopeptidase
VRATRSRVGKGAMHGLRSSVIARLRRPWSWAVALVLVALAGGALRAGPPPDPADCEERLEAAIAAISTHPRVKDVPPAKIRATTEFALGNTLFALLHEMAHGLIADLGLPVLGREEDAADAFATIAMLEMKTEFTHRVLVNAAKSWMIVDRRTRESGEPVVYYDAHGLDLQRAYNIICLMVGSDPDQFDDLAGEVNMPEDRRGTCMGDYSNASWSWNKALAPYLRTPEQERTKYQAVYGKAEGSLDIFERSFRAAGLLERVADHSANLYAWRKPFGIEAKTCGESGANWSLPDHKIYLCYELTEEFVQLYKLHGEDTLMSLSPPAGYRPGVPLGFK